MTTVEILYRLAALPTEKSALALARTSDVYGVRRLALDRQTQTLRVEFDATRLNAATVTKLVTLAGVQIAEELPLSTPPAPKPEPAPTPAAS